ncbi:E3 ubiquitin-protein ligase PPP1R11 [Halyomorpha halys]|uniref:E3 ubiquitin-protein ligase PPP1R11 n=1 Tax=Halyomorpha halys TaxID=286706 RepID=UPI0006D50876|nr:E3 ubiquitin-protein ligase PPP1R11-like [Halyomorpha halys]
MAERVIGPSFSSETQTLTVDEVDNNQEDVRAVKLTLKKPKTDKQVKWSTETVDNEHMNKKKSKCCCIYEKPRNFGESSSEGEDECENCFGHVELKHKVKTEGGIPSAPPTELTES